MGTGCVLCPKADRPKGVEAGAVAGGTDVVMVDDDRPAKGEGVTGLERKGRTAVVNGSTEEWREDERGVY